MPVADPTTFTESDFVVVANRLPVDLERLPDGTTRWKRSPGGLVTALEPILRTQRGAWVGWAGVADADLDPIVDDDLVMHPVPLSAQEIADYYEGFSNATLWPLYHDVIVRPEYHREWWNAYVEVNRRFAEAAAKAAAQGATVWVQDYQLQLVPKMLRMLRPDLTIGFFLHIPFPPVELFMQMPWRTEIVDGLLGADLIGFHLPVERRTSCISPGGWPGTRPPAQRRCPIEARGSCRSDSAPSGSARSPHLHRVRRARRTVPPQVDPRPRQADPQGTRQPEAHHARRRPARLHQGHRRPARRAARTDRRGSRRPVRDGDGAARDTEPRTRRVVHPHAR